MLFLCFVVDVEAVRITGGDVRSGRLAAVRFSVAGIATTRPRSDQLLPPPPYFFMIFFSLFLHFRNLCGWMDG